MGTPRPGAVYQEQCNASWSSPSSPSPRPLVRAGHTVLVEVPAKARELVALGYGPLPQGEIEFADGHAAVRFEACAPGGPSSSNAGPGVPVTFWSGFVLVSETTCAPLDLFVDDETEPRRVEIALGADC